MRATRVFPVGLVLLSLSSNAFSLDEIGVAGFRPGRRCGSRTRCFRCGGNRDPRKGRERGPMAAAATLLALSVTDYGAFAFGGEVPLLIYDAKEKEVKVLCGLGRAPLDQAAIDWYYEHGIPADGSMKSAPVPGAPDMFVSVLRLYGTISFEEAAAPTLRLLDDGEEDWHPRLAATIRRMIDAEQNETGSRDEKLNAARDRFYKGDIADELEAWYIETGSFLRKADLAAHRTTVENPVSVEYRGYKVYKCPPWTQGPYLCQTLQILEGFDLGDMGGSLGGRDSRHH